MQELEGFTEFPNFFLELPLTVGEKLLGIWILGLQDGFTLSFRGISRTLGCTPRTAKKDLKGLIEKIKILSNDKNQEKEVRDFLISLQEKISSLCPKKG